MNRLEKVAMIRERRARTHVEAQRLAKEAGLNDEETKDYLFSADSNAIWDGEDDKPYTPPKPPVIKKEEQNPMYSEKGFCNSYLSR